METLTSTIDKTTRHIISKIRELSDTINQQDSTDNYRALHPTIAEDTHFSCAYGIYTRICHIPSHKKIPQQIGNKRRYKECVFKHSGIKLEINHRKITRKLPNTNWKLSNILLNNP